MAAPGQWGYDNRGRIMEVPATGVTGKDVMLMGVGLVMLVGSHETRQYKTLMASFSDLEYCQTKLNINYQEIRYQNKDLSVSISALLYSQGL